MPSGSHSGACDDYEGRTSNHVNCNDVISNVVGSNGFNGNGIVDTYARWRDEEALALRREVNELKQLVLAQQATLTVQQASISTLQSELTQAKQVAGAVVAAAATAPATAPATPPVATAAAGWTPAVRPFDAQRAAIGDRRLLGMYDARFHSTRRGATPFDLRVLPPRIILVRHAQSEGNVDHSAYTTTPDPQVPLTPHGLEQARHAGLKIRSHMEKEAGGTNYRMFFYCSPYKRSMQTYHGIRQALSSSQLAGVQEEVQLREQDFGNFQDTEGKQREKAERIRFGRFFYRFPNGESGADVYDRITIFVDHLIRDINAGRFAPGTSLVLVTHGLALRVFLMRWLHWTVDQFLDVYNPPNAEPLILERMPEGDLAALARRPGFGSGDEADLGWMHTKSLYRLADESRAVLRGCTSDMCSTAAIPPGGGAAHDGCEQQWASAAQQWAELGGGW